MSSSPGEILDAHLREIIAWHFSPETGTPTWIDWAKGCGWNPIERVQTVSDLFAFPNFDGDRLRYEPADRWIPRAYGGRPYNVFETGGTTGMPKQRLNWNDYQHDYEQFSASLGHEAFPPGGNWLMIGPTGPRRLRLSIEHLANFRNSICFFVDLDPRWVKKLIAGKQFNQATAYMEHVVDQAVTILKHRPISALFTTPRLLEALGEKICIPDAGVRGVFCGGTEMNPQTVRFLMEEVLEGRVSFVPTYGNTLMGLAHSVPVGPENGFSVTYYSPQPRAVVRVTDPGDPASTVPYGEWGRVELSTLTKEFFLPRFLERDEAIRKEPCEKYPWDGVGEVRPFGASEQKIVEGVY